jgi:hypothetical protein
MGKFNPNEHMINMDERNGQPRLYLETKWRIVWFREDHPAGRITTEIVAVEPVPLVKASISDGDGNVIATAHGTATDKGNAVWSGRAIEKAETAAIGRALAHAGYGSQFTDDDDESDNLADSPVEKKVAPKQEQPKTDKVKATIEPHWTTDKQVVDRLYHKAFAEYMLSAAEVLKALGVKEITEYKGTAKEALDAVIAYDAKLKEAS